MKERRARSQTREGRKRDDGDDDDDDGDGDDAADGGGVGGGWWLVVGDGDVAGNEAGNGGLALQQITCLVSARAWRTSSELNNVLYIKQENLSRTRTPQWT